MAGDCGGFTTECLTGAWQVSGAQLFRQPAPKRGVCMSPQSRATWPCQLWIFPAAESFHGSAHPRQRLFPRKASGRTVVAWPARGRAPLGQLHGCWEGRGRAPVPLHMRGSAAASRERGGAVCGAVWTPSLWGGSLLAVCTVPFCHKFAYCGCVGVTPTLWPFEDDPRTMQSCS